MSLWHVLGFVKWVDNFSLVYVYSCKMTEKIVGLPMFEFRFKQFIYFRESKEILRSERERERKGRDFFLDQFLELSNPHFFI